MKNKDRSYLKNRTLFQSFQNAYNGIRLSAVSEKNLRIHLVAAITAVFAGIILKIDSVRWAVLMLTIGMVLVCELLNTSIEQLTDMVTSEYSEKAKKVKDIAAAAVLIAAILSLLVGAFVFYNPIIDFLRGNYE